MIWERGYSGLCYCIMGVLRGVGYGSDIKRVGLRASNHHSYHQGPKKSSHMYIVLYSNTCPDRSLSLSYLRLYKCITHLAYPRYRHQCWYQSRYLMNMNSLVVVIPLFHLVSFDSCLILHFPPSSSPSFPSSTSPSSHFIRSPT